MNLKNKVVSAINDYAADMLVKGIDRDKYSIELLILSMALTKIAGLVEDDIYTPHAGCERFWKVLSAAIDGGCPCPFELDELQAHDEVFRPLFYETLEDEYGVEVANSVKAHEEERAENLVVALVD